VAPVLDGDVERMPAVVEVGDDRLDSPVAVAVDDVAAVAPSQQVGVEPRVVGPGLGVRSDTDPVVVARPVVARAVVARPVVARAVVARPVVARAVVVGRG
jgi:hypothetical protein